MLASAQHQYKSAIDISMSPPSLNLPPNFPIPPCRPLQSSGLSSPSHITNSHCLSILHMVMNMFPCYSLHSFHSLLPPTPHIHKSALYVCLSTAVLQIGSGTDSFIILVLLTILEFAVAIIQAYIFYILFALHFKNLYEIGKLQKEI